MEIGGGRSITSTDSEHSPRPQRSPVTRFVIGLKIPFTALSKPVTRLSFPSSMVMSVLIWAVRTKILFSPNGAALAKAGLPMAENCGGSIILICVVMLATPGKFRGNDAERTLFLFETWMNAWSICINWTFASRPADVVPVCNFSKSPTFKGTLFNAASLSCPRSVSYTHLTLPTTERV